MVCDLFDVLDHVMEMTKLKNIQERVGKFHGASVVRVSIADRAYQSVNLFLRRLVETRQSGLHARVQRQLLGLPFAPQLRAFCQTVSGELLTPGTQRLARGMVPIDFLTVRRDDVGL